MLQFFLIFILQIILLVRAQDAKELNLENYEAEIANFERNFLRSISCPECADQVNHNDIACGVRICNCSSGDKADLRIAASPRNETGSLHLGQYELLPIPHLHCVDSIFIAFTWEAQPGTFYWFSYYDWPTQVEETDVTRCGHLIINDLIPEILYTFRMYSITVLEDGIRRGRSPLFRYRLRSGAAPFPVKNLSVQKWYLKDNQYTAHLTFQKGRDAACYYNVVWFSDTNADYEMLEITDPLAPEEFNITGLLFGQEYYIGIAAYTRYNDYMNESPKRWLNVSVPSCIEAYVGLKNCIPDQPENLTVIEKFKEYDTEMGTFYFNVYMQWSEPKHSPDYYVAKLLVFDEESPELKNISGDSTNATFSYVRLGSEYTISLAAYSARGASLPAMIRREINATLQHLLEDNVTLTIELIVMFIICPLVVAGIILLVVVNHFLSKKVRHKQMQKYFRDLENEKLPASVMTSISTISEEIMKPIDKWEIDNNRLAVKTLLGEGEFGVVRRGWLTNDDGSYVEVAIKMMKDNPTAEEMKQFFQEIEIMKSVPAHPHLVSLIGCVTRGSTPLLVVEYCSKGDLQTYLRKAWKQLTNTVALKKSKLAEDSNNEFVSNKLYDFSDCDLEDIPKPKDLLSYARQIVIGMEHLASLKLIHRDLAARNVLIQDANTVKISDFGLSRDVYYDNVYCKQTGGKLPIRWMALESMTHQMYTTQSDIWSFGILLWEIVTMGGTPYPGVATQDLLGLLKSGYRMEKPPNCSEDLYAIMSNCWKTCPNERPTFSELRETFDGLLQEVSCYLNLDFSESKELVQHYTIDAHYNKTYFQERYIKPLK